MRAENAAERTPAAHPFAAGDVADILRRRGWMKGTTSAVNLLASEKAGDSAGPEVAAWLERAAALLGPQAAEGPADAATARGALEDLLGLVFRYDAGEILASPECHAVLLREGAREVIRELAHLVLDGPEVDSDRFKEIISALKEKTGRRGRELFHPLRLALAGRSGEGELDRVVLLLDSAAGLPFAAPVKNTRQRMLEFCAALD